MKVAYILEFNPCFGDFDGQTKIFFNILTRMSGKINYDVFIVHESIESNSQNPPIENLVFIPLNVKGQKKRFMAPWIGGFKKRYVKKLCDEYSWINYNVIHTTLKFLELSTIHPHVLIGANDSLSLAIKVDSFRSLLRKMLWKMAESYMNYYPANFSFVSEKDSKIFGAKNKSVILRNGLDSDKYKPIQKFENRLPNSFVFHGILDYEHNIKSIEFTHGILMHAYIDFTLYLVGRFNRNESELLINKYKNLKNVVVIGEVTDISMELNKYQYYIALLVSGSGIKNKIIEAMACGLPVFANKKAISGLLQNDEFYGCVNVVENAADLQQQLSLGNDFEKQGQDARTYVKRNYDWEEYVLKLVKYYHEINE